MGSYIKNLKYFATITVLSAGLVFPVLAMEQDYILVSIRSVDGNFKVSSITQLVRDGKDISIYPNGNYRLDLLINNGVVAKNFFEVPNLDQVEAVPKEPVGSDRAGEYYSYQPKYQDIFVYLPLGSDIDVRDSSIQISKDGQVLLNQTLSEIPIKVISGASARIITPTPSASFPPFPTEDIPSSNNWLLWILGGVALVIVASVIILFVRKQPNRQQPPLPPAEPPSQPMNPS